MNRGSDQSWTQLWGWNGAWRGSAGCFLGRDAWTSSSSSHAWCLGSTPTPGTAFGARIQGCGWLSTSRLRLVIPLPPLDVFLPNPSGTQCRCAWYEQSRLWSSLAARGRDSACCQFFSIGWLLPPDFSASGEAGNHLIYFYVNLIIWGYVSASIAVRCCCLKQNYSQGKLHLGGYLHGFNESNEVLFVPGFPLPLNQAQTLSLLRSAFNLI